MNVSRSLIPRIANRVGLCVLALAASMATPLVIADDDGVRKAEQARMDHVELQEALGILAGGDAAARRKVAEDACYRFKALDSFPYDETMLNQIMEDLRRYLRHEEEDWISMLLVQRIDCHDSHFLQPLFLDALAGPSPNLHWRVYQWLRYVELPEAVPLLEDAWPGERRPWARSDLIRALAWNHSSRYLEEFRNLAEDDDPELSSAAIGAIILLDDQSALPLLARLAREGTDWQRRESADALSLMPESPVALAALLDATDDEDSRTRRCAVRSLAKRGDPVAFARVLAVTFTDPDEEVRKTGLESLKASSWQSFAPEILKRIPDDPEADRDTIENRILRIVGHFPARASRPNITWPRKPRRQGREPRCTYWPEGALTADNPRSMRASPPAARGSVRCFEAPGVAGDPHDFWRLPGGSLLWVTDHFENHDGPWLNVHGFETPLNCWLPAAQVVPASEEDPPEEEEGILQREIDLSVQDIGDPYFIALKQAGMAKVIESGDELVTVSLRVRLDSPEDETLVRQAELFSDSLASTNILRMILDAYTRLCDYPTMMEFSEELGQPVQACSVRRTASPSSRAGEMDQ